MAGEVSIDVAEVRLALAGILDAVEARYGSTLDLAADYYWTVDLQRSFDPYAEPGASLTAGQLTDDVEEIRDMLGEARDPVIWHDLSHVVGVLRRIAALDLPDASA
jgi:hypothetical protein